MAAGDRGYHLQIDRHQQNRRLPAASPHYWLHIGCKMYDITMFAIMQTIS